MFYRLGKKKIEKPFEGEGGGGGLATSVQPNHLPSPPRPLFVRPRVNLGARFTSKMVMDMQNVITAIIKNCCTLRLLN